jgi:hypothetical protein
MADHSPTLHRRADPLTPEGVQEMVPTLPPSTKMVLPVV